MQQSFLNLSKYLINNIVKMRNKSVLTQINRLEITNPWSGKAIRKYNNENNETNKTNKDRLIKSIVENYYPL